MRFRLITLFVAILFSGCGLSTSPPLNTDSTSLEESPYGDTVLITYPKEKNDNWNCLGLYENGNLYHEIHIEKVDSTELMNSTWYYPDGKIWKYKLYQYNDLKYYRDYNEKGEVVKSRGVPFLYEDTLNEFTVLDTGLLKRFLFAPTIPNCRITVLISDSDLRTDTTAYARQHSALYELYPPRASYPIDFHREEDQTKYVFWLIEDTLSGDEQNGCFIDRFVFE